MASAAALVLVTLALSGSLAAPQLQASAPEAKDASTPVLLAPSPPPQTTPSAPSATPGEAGFQPAGAAATPRGLPDYDELRRRLFFIGDVPPPSPALLPPFEDAVKVAVVTAVGNGEVAAVAAPALVMLPPVGDESPVTGPATFPSKAIVGKMSNYADGDDLRSADLMLHDKGALAVLGELLTRPGARFRLRTQSQQPAPLADSPATRDQDIRAAMEADVFQGPAEDDARQGRQGRSMPVGGGASSSSSSSSSTPPVAPGRTFRWSIPTNADGGAADVPRPAGVAPAAP